MTSQLNSRNIAPAMDNSVDTVVGPPTRHRTSRRFVQQRHHVALTHALTADRSENWAWWPLAMDRVREFALRYPCEMNIDAFIQTLTAHFIGGSPLARVWIATSVDGPIVAHMVATIERRMASPTAGFVWQFESDVPLSRHEREKAFSELLTWAKEHGAALLELWTEHNPVLWTRTYGFVPHRTIMRRTL